MNRRFACAESWAIRKRRKPLRQAERMTRIVTRGQLQRVGIDAQVAESPQHDPITEPEMTAGAPGDDDKRR